MNTIQINPSIKQHINQIKESILIAKREMGNAWLDLAINLRTLKTKIEEIGDRTTNWRSYVGVDSFKDYCNNILHLSDKTCYQMIDSLQFIETTNPQLLEGFVAQNQSTEIPPWTKVNAIVGKSRSIKKNAPNKYNELVDLTYDSSVSRRDFESKIKQAITTDSIVEVVVQDKPEPKDEKIKAYIEKAKTKLFSYVKSGNLQKINQWVNGIMDLAGSKYSSRPESTGLKRIIVAQSAVGKPYTEEVIDRARNLDPSIDVLYLGQKEGKNQIIFPESLSTRGKFWYSKESLLLRDRGPSSFIETFPSPGNIIEKLSIVMKLGFHCRYHCQYCYLQGSSYPWQEIYTNLERAASEVAVERQVYWTTQTLWSAYSFYNETMTYKIPLGLSDVGNKIRKEFNRRQINTDVDAMSYLQDNLETLLPQLGIKVEQSRLEYIIGQIPRYYIENSKQNLEINVGEYTDIIACDPVSNHMKFVFDEIIDKYEDIDIAIWTKSTNFDEVLKRNGRGRFTFTYGLSTEYVNKQYELGTPELEEKIACIKNLQAAPGYKIRLSFEPIIKYPNCVDEYVDLIHRIMNEVNTEKIDGLNISTVRLKAPMKGVIPRNYPWTDLFDDPNMYPEYDNDVDRRYRNEEEFRINLYQKLIEAFRVHSDAPISLGAEIPEMWDWVGLDRKDFFKDQVFQHPGRSVLTNETRIFHNNKRKES